MSKQKRPAAGGRLRGAEDVCERGLNQHTPNPRALKTLSSVTVPGEPGWVTKAELIQYGDDRLLLDLRRWRVTVDGRQIATGRGFSMHLGGAPILADAIVLTLARAVANDLTSDF